MENILKRIKNDNDNKANTSLKMKEDMINFLINNYTGNNILEFGTAHGNTTAILAQICKSQGGIVYTVEFDKHKSKQAKILLKTLELDKHVVFIIADLYKDNWSRLVDNVEFSFIDAVHTTHAVHVDTSNAITLGSKFICYHDYGLNLIKQDFKSGSAVKTVLEAIQTKFSDMLLIGEKQGRWVTSAGTNDYEGCIIKVLYV